METMQHALARDRMLRAEQQARHVAMTRELAATRRWRRVITFARAAERRHAARVHRVVVR